MVSRFPKTDTDSMHCSPVNTSAPRIFPTGGGGKSDVAQSAALEGSEFDTAGVYCTNSLSGGSRQSPLWTLKDLSITRGLSPVFPTSVPGSPIRLICKVDPGQSTGSRLNSRFRISLRCGPAPDTQKSKPLASPQQGCRRRLIPRRLCHVPCIIVLASARSLGAVVSLQAQRSQLVQGKGERVRE